MNTRSSRGIQPGGVTILVIFTVLCLAIFSVLSLGTVRADARLSQKYADLTQSYYSADSLAEIWMRDSDLALRELIRQNADETAFWSAVQITFGEAFDPAQRQLRFETPLSENQSLQVCLQLTRSDTPIERVVSHMVVSTTEVTFDDSLPLWEGEEMNLSGLPDFAV